MKPDEPTAENNEIPMKQIEHVALGAALWGPKATAFTANSIYAAKNARNAFLRIGLK